MRDYLSNQQEENESLSVSEKWWNVFEHFKINSIPCNNLKNIAEFIMCLPGTNASVERIFSNMNLIWTDEKSRMKVETVKAELQVKTNFGMSCNDFKGHLAKNENILKGLHSCEKYIP